MNNRFLRQVLGLEPRCPENLKPDPPAAPNYAAAAVAQGAANKDAALYNTKLGRPNEYTPYGERIWTQVPNPGNKKGKYSKDEVPQYQSKINFTPEGQKLFDADMAIKLGMSNIGQTALTGVQNSLSKPVDFTEGRDELVDAMYGRATRIMDPQWEQAETKMRDDLVNRGFSVGNEGYNKQQGNFQLAKDSAYGDARDRAMTQGTQQRIQEILMERNLPLQELNAIRTGAMPQNPSFQNFTSGSAAAAPIFQGAQAQGQADMGIYNSQVAQSNALLNGLFSLGAGGLAGGYFPGGAA